MELHAVQVTLRICEGGNRSRRGRGDDLGASRRSGDRVPVRHPDRLLSGQSGEELGLRRGQIRLPELGYAGSLDSAAEIQGEQLRAVADAERRNPELEQA